MSNQSATVLAKFRCTQVASHGQGNVHVTFEPHYEEGDDAINKSWAEATPSGKIEMWITNPALCEHFIPGRQYFVNLALAPDEEQDLVPA